MSKHVIERAKHKMKEAYEAQKNKNLSYATIKYLEGKIEAYKEIINELEV